MKHESDQFLLLVRLELGEDLTESGKGLCGETLIDRTPLNLTDYDLEAATLSSI
jgi:hypothetical protein